MKEERLDLKEVEKEHKTVHFCTQNGPRQQPSPLERIQAAAQSARAGHGPLERVGPLGLTTPTSNGHNF